MICLIALTGCANPEPQTFWGELQPPPLYSAQAYEEVVQWSEDAEAAIRDGCAEGTMYRSSPAMRLNELAYRGCEAAAMHAAYDIEELDSRRAMYDAIQAWARRAEAAFESNVIPGLPPASCAVEEATHWAITNPAAWYWNALPHSMSEIDDWFQGQGRYGNDSKPPLPYTILVIRTALFAEQIMPAYAALRPGSETPCEINTERVKRLALELREELEARNATDNKAYLWPTGILNIVGGPLEEWGWPRQTAYVYLDAALLYRSGHSYWHVSDAALPNATAIQDELTWVDKNWNNVFLNSFMEKHVVYPPGEYEDDGLERMIDVRRTALTLTRSGDLWPNAPN